MNKISMIVLAAVLVLYGSSVFGQTIPSSNSNSADAQQLMQARYRAMGAQRGMVPPMIDKEKIEKIMQSLLEMGLLYKMLEQPTMVSTSDGFIVAYGNTLRKYDKDLNVVKEVDLDVNVDNMQDLASRFAKKYADDLMSLMPGMPGAPNAAASAYPSPYPSAMPIPSTSASMGTTAAPDTNKSPDDQHEEEIKKEIEQMK